MNFGDLDEDDIYRLKMGRFSDADEKMIARLVSGPWGSSALAKILGFGVNPSRAGYASKRVRTRLPGGAVGTTFGFSMRWATKRHERPVPKDKKFFSASSSTAKEVGAKWDKHVRCGDGQKGAWSVKTSVSLPRSSSIKPVSVTAYATGLNSGFAGRFQAYIERESAAVYTIGSVDGLHARIGMWEEIERIEQAGGRAQARITAELPYEQEIGAAGRERIVSVFCDWFRDMRLPFTAAIHAPEKRNDERNYHVHILWHDRPIEDWFDGRPIFSKVKNRDVHSRDFPAMLRSRWSDCVNREFPVAGLARRFDPRSYDESGAMAVPAVHLGSKSMGMEKKGQVTRLGQIAAGAMAAGRLLRATAQQDRFTAKIEQRVSLYQKEIGMVKPLLTRIQDAGATTEHLSAAVINFARMTQEFAKLAAEFREAKARRMVQIWRAKDLPVRLSRASTGHPDRQVRRITGQALVGLKTQIRKTLIEAVSKERFARRAYVQSAVDLRQGRGILDTEKMVSKVELAALNVADLRAEIARKDLPDAVEKQRQEIAQRLSRCEARTNECAQALVMDFIKYFGKKNAPLNDQPPAVRSMLNSLFDRSRRASAVTALMEDDRGQRLAPHIQALRAAVKDEDQALIDRRRREQRDHQGMVWTPDEAGVLIQMLTNSISAFDSALGLAQSNPLAIKLLDERGIWSSDRGTQNTRKDQSR